MGMTPIEFFEAFVEGNRKDCLENPDCVRRAFNAAVAASHFADHYFTYYKQHSPSLISQFTVLGEYVEHVSSCTKGAFQDIRSIANAYKHLYTDTDPRKPARSSISSCGAIESIAFMATDPDLDTISEREVVFFTRKDGSRAKFLPVLDRVVDYWRDLLRADNS